MTAAGEHDALDQELDEHLAGVDPRVRARISEWAQKLIDLSRRNRLLIYRPTKRSTLVFRVPEPDLIVKRLVDSRTWSIYVPPRLPPTTQDPNDPKPPTLDEVLRAHPPGPNEVVTEQRDPIELEASLLAVSRKATAEYEDRGTHTLHVIWSLLRWTDPGSQQDWVAPLILVPVQVRRTSGSERFELTATDEDAVLNPALRVKLENDFGIKLPEIDLESMELLEVTNAVRDELRNLGIGWSIEPYAALGLFSFAKEPMYRDLLDHADEVAASPAVQSLALGAPVDALKPTLEVGVPGEESLDQAQAPADSFSVLDGDSSQRLAVEAAVRGQSFVLFGPPGTGKSQTISNIIAEFVARGRSVLFVSEKMAALEVVANRLREAELGDLLLELHSSKASRSEVARQLLASLDESIASDDRDFASAASTLITMRPRLNEYVSALHETRMPLGRSVFDAIAELDGLVTSPALPAPSVDPAFADRRALDQVVSSTARLADAWEPVSEGPTFVWRSATVRTFSAIDHQRVNDILGAAATSLTALMETERVILGTLEMPAPSSPDARDRLYKLGELLADPHPGPIEWLTTDDLAEYGSVINAWSDATDDRGNEVDRLHTAYGLGWPTVQPDQARAVLDAFDKLDSVLGAPLTQSIATEALDHVMAASRAILGELDRLDPILVQLRGKLGVHARGDGVADVQTLVDVARISQARHRPPSLWLARARLEEAESFVDAHQRAFEDERQASARLKQSYDEAVLELDLEPLLDRMRRYHGRWWNLLRPSHRRDRRTLTTLSTVGRLSTDVIADLESAVELKSKRSELASLEPEARAVLGPYAGGLETDFVGVRQAIRSARRLIDLPHEATDWEVLATKVAFESEYDPAVDRDADQVVVSLGVIDQALATLGGYLATGQVARLTTTARDELRAELSELIGRAKGAEDALAVFVAHRSASKPSIDEVRIEAMARLAIADADRRLSDAEDELKASFRDRWQGYETDWTSLRAALDWSIAVRAAYDGQLLSELAASRVMGGSAASLPWHEHGRRRETYESAIPAVASLYQEPAAAEAASVLKGDLVRADDFISKRMAQVDRLGIWVQHLAAVEGLDALGWGAFAAAAIERAISVADLVPAVRRAWLESWVANVINGDHRLVQFSRQDQERSVEAFRDADQTLIRVARERVIQMYENRKPASVTLQGGEQAVVRQEARKKRRLKPVRTLLAAIPNLLPLIKPALMMSPLSVSHFLTPSTRFDLVIFDEASQVPPEDAINCIYRGKQLIVAGDPKQLPPTDFFRLSATIESDLDLDTQVDDFESVLDLASGSGFVSRPLRWHYRSFDDSLIAFSNRFIYGGSLVTFPSSARNASEVGVSFVHCADAVFDRGRTAKNPIEARRVVDVVVAELRREPSNSLGVVAFSVAQQQTIEDEWERRIREDPELERLAGVGRLKGMFIKNLETVQGDERDVIVFSIGYGRDEDGRVLRNFGPLNREGGARRLNVAITRARQRVIVVSSIRADDIPFADATSPIGMPKGADLLRAYLEYAEHGTLPAMATDSASRGPAESVFESEVAAAIRFLGWETVTQVGASSYRIDIGVVSRLNPSRYAAGVECDGAMYHSAKTARDRDRLRQAVLERLGWRVVRVWSQDWFGHREAAIHRLKSELEAAEARMVVPPGPPAGPGSGTDTVDDVADRLSAGSDTSATTGQPAERGRISRAPIDLREASNAVNLSWTVPYPWTALPEYTKTWVEFHDPGMTRQHASMLGALVDEEGPVHRDYAASRLAHRFGLQRVGQRMSFAIDVAIQEAIRSGRIAIRGPFLWPKPMKELTHVRVPVRGRPETIRTIDKIPPEEIDVAILQLVKAASSIDEASLRISVARVLGFDRTADRIGEHVDARINAAVDSGKLAAVEGSLTLGRHASRESVLSRSSTRDGQKRDTLAGDPSPFVLKTSRMIERELQRLLGRNAGLSALLFEVRSSPYYVQCARVSDGLNLEAVSDEFLGVGERLGVARIEKLTRLGWPAAAKGENFSLEVVRPISATDVAALLAVTLIEVYGATEPSQIIVHAID